MIKERIVIMILLVFPFFPTEGMAQDVTRQWAGMSTYWPWQSMGVQALEKKVDSLICVIENMQRDLRGIKSSCESATYLKAVPLDSLFVRDSMLCALQRSEAQGLIAASEEELKKCIQEQEAMINGLKKGNSVAIGLLVVLSVILCMIFKRLGRGDSQKMFTDDVQHFLDARLAQGFTDLSMRLDAQPMKRSVVEEQGLSTQDVVAYNDGIQAFVNINNYVYDLRRHNALMTRLLQFWAGAEVPSVQVKDMVDLKSVPEEERSHLSLLILKIEQFKRNNQPAIERYLKLSGKRQNYVDCVRCPLGQKFDDELDQNLLGDEMREGQIVEQVFKLGFNFPDSRFYPYREKALVL